jgi:ABC-type dipeptide transport system, periplasmic component
MLLSMDGAKVTANDVIASLNHHRGEASTSAAKALLSGVVELVDGGDSVTIKLDAGTADLPWLLTDYHIPICPANADGSINWQTGMGSGPYKIEDADFGVRYRLTKHDGWHGEGAYFDELDYQVINDPNARQTALITGDVDAVSQLDLKTIDLLKRDPNIELDDVPSAAAITMPMLTDTAPFDNNDVRMALKYSIDRQEMIDKIAYGYATIGNDFHHSPAMPYWPDSITQTPYDPDKAKFHLKKAGAEGLTIDLVTADSVYSRAVDMCSLYAESAKAAGN